MNETSAKVAALVRERHAAMTAEERLRAAASLFETARAIVDASLPADLTREERRLAIVQRLYGTELPEAALIAHARFVAVDG